MVYTVCHSTKYFKKQLYKKQNLGHSTKYFKKQLYKKQNLGQKIMEENVQNFRTFTIVRLEKTFYRK